MFVCRCTLILIRRARRGWVEGAEERRGEGRIGRRNFFLFLLLPLGDLFRRDEYTFDTSIFPYFCANKM